ncbi:hypothetical protein ABWJ11_003928 [Salmonella enterica]|nr:hypothetical protein [Salmonella enterica]EHM2543781.1 hypothetical protein [Salmonella enterica subsp. enterica serovar Oranienburg]EHM5731603.1 hypothetical protein [Salmonella enterica subsp. enterica serovar Poona]EHK3368152.1 hypothetical protein [Salmonella enterica]EHK5305441.1 hypothetical protein [Salmonella enterica]
MSLWFSTLRLPRCDRLCRASIVAGLALMQGCASPLRLRDDERLYHMSWPDYAVILSSRLLFLSLGAPSAPGCLTASGRQARLRRAVAGAPARLRRTRWRGFGLRYGLMSETPACSDRSGLAAIVAPETALSAPLTGRKAFSLLPLPLRPVSRCGLSGG